MLCISEKDIMKAVSLEEMLDLVEGTMRFYETKDFLMPMRYHLDYEGNTLLLMPCFTPKAYGTKLVSLFPENASKNKPMINAVVLLNDGETGETKALINGRVVTAMRTAAVGGAGVRRLSPERPHGLGIVGAGVQGLWQARFAATARRLTGITVFDAQPHKSKEFVEELSKFIPGLAISAAASVEELLEKSETIITATTSEKPVLPDDAELLRGRHFVGIGSYKPSMREFPETLFRLVDRVFIDTEHAIDETGDLIDPLREGWISRDRVQTMGSLLESGEDPALLHNDTTLFKSVGMALFDVDAAGLIYRKALEKGLGQEVDL